MEDKTLQTPEQEVEKKKTSFKGFLIKIKFDQWKGWLYLVPCIVLTLIFTVWPIINTVRISLLEGYNSLAAKGGEIFSVGIGNFTHVLKAPNFGTCLKNTLLLCVLTVPISTLLALIIAVCLNAIKP